jgi:hypothetical protein
MSKLRRKLAETTDALEIALEPWSGSMKINGMRLIAENREILSGLTYMRKPHANS